MKKEFTVIIEQDEQGYFIAEAPELAGCHTQAKSLDVLLERTKEAIQLCLEVYGRRATKTTARTLFRSASTLPPYS